MKTEARRVSWNWNCWRANHLSDGQAAFRLLDSDFEWQSWGCQHEQWLSATRSVSRLGLDLSQNPTDGWAFALRSSVLFVLWEGHVAKREWYIRCCAADLQPSLESRSRSVFRGKQVSYSQLVYQTYYSVSSQCLGKNHWTRYWWCKSFP